MKQLTKEQLMDLVYDNCVKVTEENAENMAKSVSDFTKDVNDLGEEILKTIMAYCMETKRECCHTFVETIYDILYNE